MQEVQGFLEGDWNYANLKGDTGPLVYPAGFVWIYSALYYITNLGKNIKVRAHQLAQWIFLGIYVVNQYVVLSTYSHLGAKWTSLCVLCASYRLHSIFMLRLFNDPVAMLFLNIAIYRAVHNKWAECVTWFSLALSVKMNILLYLPGLLLCLFLARGSRYIIKAIIEIVVSQVLVALPFLWHDAPAYLSRAFEFSRIFEQKWSVNWQFLSRELFTDPRFHLCLLGLHVGLLLVYLYRQTGHLPVSFLTAVVKDIENPPHVVHLPAECKGYAVVVRAFYLTNFIGIVCCRSLHYQFYSWYFHSLPFLALSTGFSIKSMLLLACIEYAFVMYPPTSLTSICLQLSHATILVRVSQLVAMKACVKPHQH